MNPDTEPEQISAQIEQTRAALGDTVAALAAKADVKARLTETGNEFSARIAAVAGAAAAMLEDVAVRIRRHPAPWMIGAALAVLVLLSPRRRRRS